MKQQRPGGLDAALSEQLIEDMAEAIYVHDHNGRILYANPAAGRQAGYALDRLQSLNMADLEIDIFSRDVPELINRCLPGVRKSAVVHARCQPTSDDSFPVVVNLARIQTYSTSLFASTVRRVDHDTELRDSLEKKIAFNRLLLEISLSLVNLDPDHLDEVINSLLAEIGRFFEVDRSYLFTIDWQADTITNTHEWIADGIAPAIQRLQRVAFAGFPWLREHMRNNRMAHAPDVDALPEEAALDREEYQEQSIKTLLIVPIVRGDEVTGMFGLDSVRCRQHWDEEIQDDLRLLGQLLAGAMDASHMGRQLRHMAYHDVLTQLPNRKLLGDRIQQAVARCRRHDCRSAVMLIDIDDFKLVNDTFTHSAGDQLLCEIADRLAHTLRDSDTVARIGGDEFVVVCEVDEVADAADLTARIQEAISQPLMLHGQRLVIHSSVGITLIPDDDLDADRLLRNADLAMYQAKASGKNRFAFFKPAMSVALGDMLKLRSELSEAIGRNQLCLHYQPLYALDCGRLSGLEALVRWNHPDRGLVAPGEFLPIAERSDLICQIDRWALMEACQQLSAMSLEGLTDFRMSVNLSARDLYDPDHVEALIETAESSGMEDGRWLRLELTESMLMEDMPRAIRHLHRFMEKLPSLSIAIDDFGSGYSSLNYLRKLPVDTLKIDRRFIADRFEAGSSSSAIVQSIISLAHNLEMHVVAEGIEQQEQYDLLRSIGCEQAQGFLLGRPAPAETLGALPRLFG